MTHVDPSKALAAGSVRNEAQIFIYGAFGDGMSYGTLEFLMLLVFKTEANVRKIKAQYPVPENVTDYRPYACELVTDGMFHCATRNATTVFADNALHDNVYLYHLNHVPSFSREIWSDTECWDNVCHGDELGGRGAGHSW